MWSGGSRLSWGGGNATRCTREEKVFAYLDLEQLFVCVLLIELNSALK
jgi:hypothetical protein